MRLQEAEERAGQVQKWNSGVGTRGGEGIQGRRREGGEEIGTEGIQ